MSCPRCGLINPRNALWCDCDYEFSTGAVSSHLSYEPDGKLCPECGLVMTDMALWCFCGHDFRHAIAPSVQPVASFEASGGAPALSLPAWVVGLLRHTAAGLRLARMNAARSG